MNYNTNHPLSCLLQQAKIPCTTVQVLSTGRIWLLQSCQTVEAATLRSFSTARNRGGATTVGVGEGVPICLGAPGDGYSDELARSIQLCPPMSELSSRHDKGINIQVDDSPIGPYLLKEFVRTIYTVNAD